MRNIVIGIAIGYVFHDAIDRVVKAATTTVEKKAEETERKAEDETS